MGLGIIGSMEIIGLGKYFWQLFLHISIIYFGFISHSDLPRFAVFLSGSAHIEQLGFLSIIASLSEEADGLIEVSSLYCPRS